MRRSGHGAADAGRARLMAPVPAAAARVDPPAPSARRPARRLGAVVLVVAALGAAVLGRLQNPREIAGSAGALPPPPPPTVGQCLLAAPVDVDDGVDVAPLVLSIGDCAAPHFGEVFAVVESATSPDEGSPCWAEESGDPDSSTYLGYPAAASDSWFPVLNYVVVEGGPDERQRAAGQAWAACAIAVWNYGDDRPFTVPLSGAHTTGSMPVQFAACLDGDEVDSANPVPCDEPHRAQYFAYRQLDGPGPTADDLATGCREYAARETRIPGFADIDSVQTTVAAHVFPDVDGQAVVDDVPLPLEPGQSGFAECLVVATGDRLLNGSLIALGDRPLPLVP